VCSYGYGSSASAYPRDGQSNAHQEPVFANCLNGILRTSRNIAATDMAGQARTGHGLVNPHDSYIQPCANLIRGNAPDIQDHAAHQNGQDARAGQETSQGLPQ
jgi:hypothetical protein